MHSNIKKCYSREGLKVSLKPYAKDPYHSFSHTECGLVKGKV